MLFSPEPYDVARAADRDRWSALRGALAARYELTDLGHERLMVSIPAGGDVARVGVRRCRDAALSSDVIEVTAVVQTRGAIDHAAALRVAATLTVGSLCAGAGGLLLRRLLDLDTLEPAKLIEITGALAELGRTLGWELAPPAATGADLGAYRID